MYGAGVTLGCIMYGAGVTLECMYVWCWGNTGVYVCMYVCMYGAGVTRV